MQTLRLFMRMVILCTAAAALRLKVAASEAWNAWNDRQTDRHQQQSTAVNGSQRQSMAVNGRCAARPYCPTYHAVGDLAEDVEVVFDGGSEQPFLVQRQPRHGRHLSGRVGDDLHSAEALVDLARVLRAETSVTTCLIQS